MIRVLQNLKSINKQDKIWNFKIWSQLRIAELVPGSIPVSNGYAIPYCTVYVPVIVNWEKNYIPLPSRTRIAEPNLNRNRTRPNRIEPDRIGLNRPLSYRTNPYRSGSDNFLWFESQNHFLGSNVPVFDRCNIIRSKFNDSGWFQKSWSRPCGPRKRFQMNLAACFLNKNVSKKKNIRYFLTSWVSSFFTWSPGFQNLQSNPWTHMSEPMRACRPSC